MKHIICMWLTLLCLGSNSYAQETPDDIYRDIRDNMPEYVEKGIIHRLEIERTHTLIDMMLNDDSFNQASRWWNLWDFLEIHEPLMKIYQNQVLDRYPRYDSSVEIKIADIPIKYPSSVAVPKE